MIAANRRGQGNVKIEGLAEDLKLTPGQYNWVSIVNLVRLCLHSDQPTSA
jgi:hypothetical protein